MKLNSQNHLRPKKTLIMILILILILPSWLVAATGQVEYSDDEIITDADLNALAGLNVFPVLDSSSGWVLENSDDAGSIDLRFRDATPITLNQWSTEIGTVVTGWNVLQHSMPVPTEWLWQLNDAGIECNSYIPHGAFHCFVPSMTIQELEELEIQGIMTLDPTDKVHPMIDELLNNQYEYGVALNGRGIITTVLSGDSIPELQLDDSLVLLHHSNRWATFAANELGISRLANNQGIEWIEPKFIHKIQNSVARDLIEIDYVSQNSEMSNLNVAWTGLTGSGVQVTVADSGLDSGVNDGTMHPDFQGRITDIHSYPIPQWYMDGGYLNPSASMDDGAADISNCLNCGNGHGTHVAGSVLGDGTSSGGSIMGAAPASTLHFQSTEQYIDWSTTMENNGYADGYGLWGLPDDINDLFSQAYTAGSRVHTNSWGSSVAGEYTAYSQQADQASYTYQDMVILFAASNDGEDANNNGEVDLDSLGSPATAKNVITVGASENDRSTLPSDSGTFVPGQWGGGVVNYAEPIYSDLTGGDPEGMAAFSSRGPTDDNRQKPEVTAPGTWILSTRSRSTAAGGWLAYDSDHVYMGGTSMATPLTAGSAALILEHLNTNVGMATPSSALVRAMFVAGADDMLGQYGDPTNGAGESIPNYHEGWGRIDLGGAINSSFVDGETVGTGEFREFSFNVPAAMPTLKVVLSYTDPASTPGVGPHLINDLDIELHKPDGSIQQLANDLDVTRGITINAPQSGTWEVHITGTNVPQGPQPFAVAVNVNTGLTNATNDLDGDGYDDDTIDDCLVLWGNSSIDRQGCIDTDGDGYSDADGGWTIANGADALPADATQWADADGDGFGDNPSGTTPDDCNMISGTSTIDRIGCPDTDGDGFSNADGGWTIANGADGCVTVSGTSTNDRAGCPDFDGDGYSDPDPSGINGPTWTTANGADAFIGDSEQWADADGDGYGDNPPPANQGDSCPSISGTSSQDRKGCTDSDSDGYSDPDGSTLAHPAGVADAFPADATQWRDTDGDGYGDESGGNNPDSCPLISGNSTENSILGCVDTDGDGWDDVSDPLPNDGTQWVDSDGDGYGDNSGGSNADLWPADPSQWLDSDGDGFGDNTTGTNGDAFPADATQWADTDNDGYGDNSGGNQGDDCPSTPGNSNQNGNYGCVDTDADGWSDTDDKFPYESTQWADTDNDGYGDNSNGAHPDFCPTTPGNSSENFKWGCPDNDGDGYADLDDALNDTAGQWQDADSDNYGDDPNGPEHDSCQYEPGNSWIDRYGCPDADGDGYSDLNDDFPNDILRHIDEDNDGFDDLSEDICLGIFGTSTIDRKGCIDTDGDGYSDSDIFYSVADGADAFHTDSTQWNDTDDDGFGDNPAPASMPDDCPSTSGTSSIILLGCVDSDGDGYPDTNDSVPNNPTQWIDSDGDGYGDNISGTQPDGCIDVVGFSSMSPFGCPDTDGDGSADLTDPLPSDTSQSTDTDNDGYGDNSEGTSPDACPNDFGTSNKGGILGCLDSDGDGYADSNDDFPNVASQWLDSDGDGYGDNNSLEASWIDYWSQNNAKNIPTSTISCTPQSSQILVDPSGELNGTCTISNTMNQAIRIIVNLELTSGIQSTQTLWYLELQATGATDATKTVSYNLNIGGVGNWNATFEILAIGSNAIISSNTITISGFESEDEIPTNTEEEIGMVESYIEMLGPVAPHVTPMSLAVVAGALILLQAGRIWSSKKSQRRVKEEFIKKRMKERIKPPPPPIRINRTPPPSHIRPSHHNSNTMRQLMGNNLEQEFNDDLLDDLI